MAKYPVDSSISHNPADAKKNVSTTDAGIGVGPLGAASKTVRFDTKSMSSDSSNKRSIPSDIASYNIGSNVESAYSRVEEGGKNKSHCEKPDAVALRVAVRSNASREHRPLHAKAGGPPAVTKGLNVDEESDGVENVPKPSGGKAEKAYKPNSLRDEGECITTATKKAKFILK